MITTTDIANILYKDCLHFGLPVFQRGNVDEGEISEERIVIYVKKQTDSTYWKNCFAEVNLCVPNLINGKANLIRLNELERSVEAYFDKTGVFNDTPYSYSISDREIIEDHDFNCYYVNVRILFNVLNVM